MGHGHGMIDQILFHQRPVQGPKGILRPGHRIGGEGAQGVGCAYGSAEQRGAGKIRGDHLSGKHPEGEGLFRFSVFIADQQPCGIDAGAEVHRHSQGLQDAFLRFFGCGTVPHRQVPYGLLPSPPPVDFQADFQPIRRRAPHVANPQRPQ